MSEGFVYILTNEAMPGYVKIGFTTQTDWSIRVKQLDTTSIPVPFECYYAAKVSDCRNLERTLHFVFGDKRRRSNREFFTIEPDLAKAIIELVAIKEEPVADIDQDIAPNERAEIEAIKARSQNLTFERLNIPLGTVLTFARDPAITCVVSGPRTVTFQGQELSPSTAALQAIRAMGYNWPAVNGFKYWMLDGVRLSDLTAVNTATGILD